MQLFPPGFTVLPSPHPHLFFIKPTKRRDSPPQSVRPPVVGIHHAGLGVSATKVRLGHSKRLGPCRKKNRTGFVHWVVWFLTHLKTPRLAKYLSAQDKSKRSKRDFPHLRYQLRGLVVLLFIASANWRTCFFFRPLLVGDFGSLIFGSGNEARAFSFDGQNLSTLKLAKSRTWRLKNQETIVETSMVFFNFPLKNDDKGRRKGFGNHYPVLAARRKGLTFHSDPTSPVNSVRKRQHTKSPPKKAMHLRGFCVNVQHLLQQDAILELPRRLPMRRGREHTTTVSIKTRALNDCSDCSTNACIEKGSPRIIQ